MTIKKDIFESKFSAESTLENQEHTEIWFYFHFFFGDIPGKQKEQRNEVVFLFPSFFLEHMLERYCKRMARCEGRTFTTFSGFSNCFRILWQESNETKIPWNLQNIVGEGALLIWHAILWCVSRWLNHLNRAIYSVPGKHPKTGPPNDFNRWRSTLVEPSTIWQNQILKIKVVYGQAPERQTRIASKTCDFQR